MTLISVLVPVYNGANFVEETVHSVLAQTHYDLELLLIDDGSTDGTPEVLERLARLDDRIRVFRQLNAGTQAARNLGLRHSRGEWIALLDHDDTWLPRKLECQLSIARSNPDAGLVFCNFARWDGRRELGRHFTREDRLPSGVVLNRLARHCLFGALTVMVRRGVLERAGGFDVRFLRCGDWDLWLRLAEHGVKVKGTIEVLARWRVWDGNLSANSVNMRHEEVRVIEAALHRADSSRIRAMYRKCLAVRQGNLALHVAVNSSNDRGQLVIAALKAWVLSPRRLRLLTIAALCLWPATLGGGQLYVRSVAKIRRSY